MAKKVAAGIDKPERVLGMHYFSPVPSMQLLEIIPHAGTNEESMSKAFSVGIEDRFSAGLLTEHFCSWKQYS